jgi:hypothetical protein
MRKCVKITYLGHATVLLDLDGLVCLCDPHLLESFGSGHFGYNPSRQIAVSKLPPLDAVFISHAHRDHFDIASLSQLPRTTPVFCPKDARIERVLTKLGYHEVITVTDWTEISPTPNTRFIWTPSRYRVPEHGLAVRCHDVTVWNLIDSIVTANWVQETLRRLATRSLDALLICCQPLIETATMESERPITSQLAIDRTICDILRQTQPRLAIPFADGHYCIGRSMWLNHHKFPFSNERVIDVVRSAVPQSGVLWIRPGDIINISSTDGSLVATDRSPIVSHVCDQDRRFHPGGWIEPLHGVVADDVRGCFGEALTNALNKAETKIQQLIVSRLPDGVALRPTTYVFRVVGCDSAVQESFGLAMRLDGMLEPWHRHTADVEVVIPADILRGLLRGDVYYTTAYLGGHIREFRYIQSEKILSSDHDALPDQGSILLSGIFVFNALFSSLDDASTKGLDYEIGQIGLHTVERAESSYLPMNSSCNTAGLGLPECDAEYDWVWDTLQKRQSVHWRDVPNEHCEAADLGHTRIVGLGIDIAMRAQSHRQATCGIIVPFALYRCQPHLGAGVRFPWNAYRALLEAILTSHGREWEILYATPGRLAIERWRVASLLPFAYGQLVDDLRRQGWTGRIRKVGEEPQMDIREWWLGVPRFEGCQPKVIVLRSFRQPIPGEVSGPGIETVFGEDYTCAEPLFRIQVDCNEIAGRGRFGLVRTLLHGRLRFSWIGTDAEASCALGCELGELDEELDRLAVSALGEVHSRVMACSP